MAIRSSNGKYFRDLPIFGHHYMFDEELKTELVECGMTGWIEKPVSFEELDLKLSKYLKLRD